MALFRRMHRRNLYQHSEFSRPGKRRRMENAATAKAASSGHFVADFVVDSPSKEEVRLRSNSRIDLAFDSGESSSVETNMDDTTDYDLESITPSSRKGFAEGVTKSMEEEERSGIGGLVDLAASSVKLVARAECPPSPVLKRRDAEELRFSWHDAINEAKVKLGVK